VLAGQQGRVDRQSRYTVTLADGASYQAAIAGTDAPDDLAVLKISAPNLRALPPADSSGLRVGQFVLAVATLWATRRPSPSASFRRCGAPWPRTGRPPSSRT